MKMEAKPALTPPASEDTNKHNDSGSELSDLELDGEFSEEIQPDHYYEGGKIPVFKPVGNFSFNFLAITVFPLCCLSNFTDLRSVMVDNGPIPKFQAFYTQDRQVWNEVRYCEGYTTERMVRAPIKPLVSGIAANTTLGEMPCQPLMSR